jgi:hypothetical protein
MNRIPVVLCIDAEPEERVMAMGIKPDWPGFELSHEFFNDLRPRLQEVTGLPVHYCWFFRMDPQIERVYGDARWVAERYASLIEQLRSAGDGLGLHVHVWKPDPESNGWYSDFADQDWVDHCVRTAFQAFKDSFGETCVNFRFGDHWLNNSTVTLVERLGARFDLTLEPGQTGPFLPERFTGSFPDYSQVPRHPYRPSKSDFTRPGSLFKRRLWIVPLSAGHAGSPQPSPAGPGMIAGTVDAERYATMNLFDDSVTLCRIADQFLGLQKDAHLVMVVRSDVVLYRDLRSNLQRTLDHLLRHPLASRLVFATPAELVQRLNPES